MRITDVRHVGIALFAGLLLCVRPAPAQATDPAEPAPATQDTELRRALADFATAYTEQLRALTGLVSELTRLQEKEGAAQQRQLAQVLEELGALRRAWLEQRDATDGSGPDAATRRQERADLVQALLVVEKSLLALRTDSEHETIESRRRDTALREALEARLDGLEQEQRSALQALTTKLGDLQSALERSNTEQAQVLRAGERERFDAKLRDDTFQAEVRRTLATLAQRVELLQTLAESEREQREAEALARARQESAAVAAEEQAGPSQTLFWALGFALLFGGALWFWVLETRKRRDLEELLAAMRVELSAAVAAAKEDERPAPSAHVTPAGEELAPSAEAPLVEADTRAASERRETHTVAPREAPPPAEPAPPAGRAPSASAARPAEDVPVPVEPAPSPAPTSGLTKKERKRLAKAERKQKQKAQEKQANRASGAASPREATDDSEAFDVAALAGEASGPFDHGWRDGNTDGRGIDPDDELHGEEVDTSEDETAFAAPRRPRAEHSPTTVPPRTAAPRLLSIRIPESEVVEGAEEVIGALLEYDGRVLVEPAPQLERRMQGALSVRFYVRGDVDSAAAEDLRRACWDLGARSQPPQRRLPED